MSKTGPTLDPIDAAITQAGRWFRVLGAGIHTGLNTLKSLTQSKKPGKVVAGGTVAAPAAEARRDAPTVDIRRRVVDVIDREAVDANHHDALVEALDARLAFNLAYVDIDILPLRERVKRLCADLRLGPGRCRWEADDFNSRGRHSDHPDRCAPRTKANLTKVTRPPAHRPPSPILALARLE